MYIQYMEKFKLHIFNIFLLKLNLKIGNQYLRISFIMYNKMLDFGGFFVIKKYMRAAPLNLPPP